MSFRVSESEEKSYQQGGGGRTEGNLKRSLLGEGLGKKSDVFKEHINLAALPGTFIPAQQSASVQHILKNGDT